MKKAEPDPSGQSTALSRHPSGLDEVFCQVLPILFHKLKNKLTPIIGYAQILKSRAVDDFSLERLAKIESNAGELADCLNVMKEYFRVPAMACQPGNLNRIIEKFKKDWQHEADKNQVDLCVDLAPELPDLHLNSGQITLLLQNLAANARAALALKDPPQKTIHLTTRLRQGLIRLVVRDNGIGIAPEELDHIWTPFYTTFAGGAGLGLVICERIIANHGGHCRVISQPGEFSEFEITFPIPDPPGIQKIKPVKKGSSDHK